MKFLNDVIEEGNFTRSKGCIYIFVEKYRKRICLTVRIEEMPLRNLNTAT